MNIENLNETEKQQLKKLLNKLNQSEFEYPIYKKERRTGLIVKFTAITTGEVIVGNLNWKKGTISSTWMPHTDTLIWEDFDLSELNKPKDKDLVWCWGDHWTTTRNVRFYDERNQTTYGIDGNRQDLHYSNYEVIPRDEWPQWAIEAYDMLED